MNQTVFIVDDDQAVREAFGRILEVAGFLVRIFSSAQLFLAACMPEQMGCILLDVQMPEMTGLELQAALSKCGILMPVVFLTAYGDVKTSVHTLQAGAFDFLEKPVPAAKLIESVRNAMALDQAQHKIHARFRKALINYAQLTLREREIMKLIIIGHPNKVVAKELAISPRTVEVHRRNILAKMQVNSLLELAPLVEILNLDESDPS